MVKDPVCGMDLEESKVTQKTFYRGKTYYFCSATCKKEFDKDPSRYIKQEGEQKK